MTNPSLSPAEKNIVNSILNKVKVEKTKLVDAIEQDSIKQLLKINLLEYGFPDRQAIDFINEDGSPFEENPSDFEDCGISLAM